MLADILPAISALFLLSQLFASGCSTLRTAQSALFFDPVPTDSSWLKSRQECMMSKTDRFRVIIVGGGVAGLTLANALEVCSSCFSTTRPPLCAMLTVCRF